LERLLQRGAALDAEPPTGAAEMIRTADDPQSLLANLTDDRLWNAALVAALEALSENWTDTFAALLPTASMAACGPIAAELHAAGRSDLLVGCVEMIMNEPDDCIEAIAWMWKGSDSLKAVTLPSRLEMLVRILSTVAELDRSGIERRDRAKTVRAAVKNALGSASCAGFRECLDGMEESMASTIRRQVGRLDGLGPALRDQMTEEIRKRFPGLWVKAKIDPWKNDTIIFTTEEGLRKLQANIDQLVNVEMPANAKAIGEAAAHGDLSENSEYKFALEARDMLRARLAAMQNQLVLAQPIEPLEITTRCVGIGTKVTLRRADGGIRTMTFLGPWDAAIENGIFNYQAPLSQQLMGRNAGDSLTIALDDGHEAEWTVERIEAGL
jgi:transcription elongation GreA/GreB family factor